MLDVFGLFSVETLYVLIGIIALLVIAIVLSIVAIAKSSSMKKKYNKMMEGSDGKDEENEITNRITIKKLISELKDNEKEVILLRYYKGKTQMQVAKILGITQVQVSRIERKVLDNMKRKLTV